MVTIQICILAHKFDPDHCVVIILFKPKRCCLGFLSLRGRLAGRYVPLM